VRDSQWARKMPVRGCNDCFEGLITRPDYNENIKCPFCKGVGTLLVKRLKDVSVITSQITKDNNKSNDS